MTGENGPTTRWGLAEQPLSSLLQLETVLFLVALGFTILYLVIGYWRVSYPHSLDFIEDNLVMQSWRVAQNEPAFVPPNADYVPQVYMPLYSWFGGLFFKLTGPAFWPLRLLSYMFTLTTAVLIYWVAQRESKSRILAFASMALFLAGYRLVGGWYELARVENLFVLVTMAGVAVAIYAHRPTWGLVLVGVLMGLSLLSKQNGMLFVAGTAVYLLFNVRTRIWIYLLTFAIVGLIPLWLANLASDGWFAIYTFGIAYASPFDFSRVADTLRREIFGAMLLLTLSLLLIPLLSLWRQKPKNFIYGLLSTHPWPVFIIAAVLVTIAGRATVGGARQNYIIGYAFLCLAPALLVGEFRHWSFHQSRWLQPLLVILLLFQFGLTWSQTVHAWLEIPNSTRFVPTAGMEAAGNRLLKRIEAIEGPVFVMMHPTYALFAGKEPSAHILSLWHARWRAQEPLPQDLVERIENQYYAAIISNNSRFFEDEPALTTMLDTYYTPMPLPERESPFVLSGPFSRPRVIYVPKE